MARDSVRPSVAVTIPMCRLVPFMTSENNTLLSDIQVKPEALGRNRVGCPPSTGTVHVSHINPSPVLLNLVYAIRDPSGVNTGAYFGAASFVSRTDSPFGSNLT